MPIINMVYKKKKGWKPWANTRVYLPLESDVVDKSWKSWRTFTTSWISYTTVWGVLSAHWTWSNYIRMDTPYPLVNETWVDTNNLTVSLWFYVTSTYSSTRRSLFEFTRYSNQNITLALKENTYIIQWNDGSWYGSDTTYNANVWNNVILTASGTNKKIYINGILKWSWNTGVWAWGYWKNSWWQTQAIITWRDLTQEWLIWNMREFIIEDKEWTAQDVSNYYNQTKANFWL